MSERRKHNRLQLTLPLEVKKKEEGKSAVKTRLVDISRGGAKFYFNDDIRVGTKMEITIDDYDDILAGKLGLETASGKHRKYRLDAQVMRAEKMNQDMATQKVAVKFSRLLKFIPDEINLN